MSKIIKAPQKFTPLKSPSVFLAGSMGMGEAKNWQVVVEEMLGDIDITILSPRRDDWDSSWEQSIDNAQFREQVEWELEAQEKADIIAMYFCAETKSPITLLELGLFAHTDKLIVCCSEGFWRKGNVDIVCKRYNIKNVDTIENLIYRILREA